MGRTEVVTSALDHSHDGVAGAFGAHVGLESTFVQATEDIPLLMRQHTHRRAYVERSSLVGVGDVPGDALVDHLPVQDGQGQVNEITLLDWRAAFPIGSCIIPVRRGTTKSDAYTHLS